MIQAVIDWMTPHVDAVALATGPHAALYDGFGVTCLDDPVAGQDGPAMGLLAGLEWAEALGADQLLLAPCDMPGLPDDLPARLTAPGFATSPSGNHYALSLWPVAMRSRIEGLVMDDGVRALRHLLDLIGAGPVSDPAWPGFADVNNRNGL